MNVPTKANDGLVATQEAAASVHKGIDVAVTNLKDGMAKVAAASEVAEKSIQDGMGIAMKAAEDIMTFGHGNVEAWVKSSQIWTAGIQDLTRQMAASAQTSIDETMAAFKSMASVKSLKDAMDVQARLTRLMLEKAMTESGRITEASFKLTERTMAPIAARMTVAADTLAKSH
jgi:phasin family protein